MRLKVDAILTLNRVAMLDPQVFINSYIYLTFVLNTSTIDIFCIDCLLYKTLDTQFPIKGRGYDIEC